MYLYNAIRSRTMNFTKKSVIFPFCFLFYSHSQKMLSLSENLNEIRIFFMWLLNFTHYNNSYKYSLITLNN